MEQRIVTLIASATEIVAALGYVKSLVGRSHECDFPTEVTLLPACSEARIDVQASSFEIDSAVKAVLRDALSVYNVFRDELERLQPTLIVTQTQCEVCAVSLRDVEAALCVSLISQPKIVSLQPMCLADIWDDIQRVADALGDAASGSQLVQTLKSRLAKISPVPKRGRPSVFCMEWLEPIMSAGNWVPELVDIAGGCPVLCQAGKHSPYLTWEQLAKADPEIVVLMPCGFDISRTVKEIKVLEKQPNWLGLRAVRDGRVYVTDGNQFFNRPGPRVVESAEILFEIIHEGLVKRQHSEDSWIRLA